MLHDEPYKATYGIVVETVDHEILRKLRRIRTMRAEAARMEREVEELRFQRVGLVDKRDQTRVLGENGKPLLHPVTVHNIY